MTPRVAAALKVLQASSVVQIIEGRALSRPAMSYEEIVAALDAAGLLIDPETEVPMSKTNPLPDLMRSVTWNRVVDQHQRERSAQDRRGEQK